MIDLINKLAEEKISLALDGDNLKLLFDGAGEGSLSDELINEIRINKPALIKYIRESAGKSDYKLIRRLEEGPDYAVSDGQRRLWVLSQIGEGSRAYHLSGQERMRGEVRGELLERAINRVIGRHEILRTVFRENELGELRQVVLGVSESVFGLEQREGKELSEEEVKRYIEERSREGFDLSRGPLLRGGLVRVGEEESIFYYTLHHIISDGWSMEVLGREVLENYEQERSGQREERPELRIQYRDYAGWQQEQLKSGQLGVQREYWLGQLGGELPVLDLLPDRVRPGVATQNGYYIGTTIDGEVTEGLRRLCREEGSTLYMGLLSVLKGLLYRYTGQEDMIVGSPVAGRVHVELEDQLGFYVNTLALRTRVKGGESFRSLLRKVREVTLSGYAHQDYPFDRLVEELEIRRDLSRSALFDVMLILQNQRDGRTGVSMGKGLAGGGEEREGECAVKFDLTVDFTERGEGLNMGVEYNRDLYDKGRIVRLMDHYKRLLRGVLCSPDMELGEVEYLSSSERHWLLEEVNDTREEYDQGVRLTDLFGRQVLERGEEIALEYRGEEYSYGELDELSNCLGRYIQERYGLEAGDLVGVRVGRGVGLVISLLGVLKTGCGYVPVDPGYPEERVSYIRSNSGYKGCIDEEELERFWSVRGGYSGKELRSAGDCRSVAYVMYTSGTTGQPKGCVLEHRGIVNRLEWMWRKYGFDHSDIILQKTRYTFDVSVWELFLPLCWGCRMVMSEQEDMYSPERLLEVIGGRGVTCVHFVPGLLDAFVGNLSGRAGRLSALRRVITSGEALGLGTLREWYSQSSVPVYNLYGPTEASIDVTYYDTRPGQSKVLIGRPVSNTQIYILDEGGRLVGRGVEGELYIGGVQVARGYINNGLLTAEKFVENPYRMGERMYRTGDRGRWTEEGEIEYLGRRDEQVKIRGYRIELGEVEHALEELEGIGSAVVVVREMGPERERSLVAYFTVSAGRGEGETGGWVSTELRRSLLEKLPEYMVPGYYVRMSELPLTANGKTDRKGLPSPETGLLGSGASYTGPRNAVERKMVEIWQELLRHREAIGIEEDFFAIGGHSLRAMQLVNHYYRWFDVKLSIEEVFRYRTIALQSERLSIQRGVSYKRICKVEEGPDYAVSDGQRRLWVLSQIGEGSRAYHLSGQERMRGEVRGELLERAINRVIGRHEILRTVFRENELGELRQVVLGVSESVFGLEQREGKELSEEEVKRYIEERSREGFDLSRGPLLRGGLVRVGEEESIFYYTLHHIISDGWSMEVLGREVLENYEQERSGQREERPELRIQYRDYAGWQQEQLKSGQLGVQREYWLGQLGGELPVLDLLPDRVRPGVATQNGYYIGTTIDGEVTEGLRRLCREEGSTLYMGLLSVLKGLLYRYTGQEDMIVGSPVAGRVHVELEDQLGFYVNTLALRTRVKGGESFRSLLRKVREVTLSGYAHQDYPFDRLVEELEIRRDLSRSALFDVMLILQNQRDGRTGVSMGKGLAGGGEEREGECAVKFDLTVDFTERGEGLNMGVEYNRDLYDKGRIVRLMDHYKRLLRGVLCSPDMELGEVEYLSSSERHWLLEEVNDTREEYDQGVRLTDLFGRQVLERGEEIALEYRGEEYSYGELDELSNCLGRYIQERYGLEAGDLVGVRVGRGVGLVISLLGVLKTGCGYVPVDPGYPEERVSYIRSNSGYKGCIDEEELERFWSVRGGYSGKELRSAGDCRSVAYVMYTSGTTGQPKGCVLEHRGIVNRLEWMWRKYGFDHSDIILQKTRYTFDVSVWELFLPLCWGCRMVMSEQEDMYSPERLLEVIGGRGVTCVHFVPGLLDAFVGNLSGRAGRLSALRRVITSGEALGLGTLREWYSQSSVPVYNLYGPTEASIDVTYYDTRPGQSKVLIGRPVSNTQIYILDEGGRLVGRGVEGELYIGGVQVARGYINNGLLTAEKFVENPYRMGERMYRTGDRGRWTEEGEIEYLGRRDEQVKIRGYRIELGEVEHALEELEGIGSAVVVVREMGPERERSLVAYFTVSAGRGEGETGGWVSTELRRSLLEKLPEYMVPGYYVRMSELPLTANGKTDRKGLPSPETGLLGSGASYMGPRNAVEEALVEIYGKIFRKEGIGVKESFFDLGGDSIKAILLSGQLKQKGYSVKVGDVLAYPVLEDLALRVVKEQRSVSQEMVEGAVLLTPVQRWFLRQANGRRHHYNQSVLLYSRRRIDRGWMEESLERLALHHDALRMVYTERGGEWEQYNRGWEGESYGLEEYDLRGEEREQERMGALCNEVQGSINLSAGPLLKGCIFRLGDGDRLLLVIHHLVVDGVSWRILLEDLSVLYGELEAGRKGVLPLKSDSFRQWSQWQWDHANSGELLKELSYWQSVEAGRGKGLRVDMEGGRNVPGSRMSAGFSLDRELTEILVTRANRVYNTEMNDMLLASLGLSLGAVFGRTGVLVEMEGHGREEVGEEMNVGRTVGWFTTMYPVLLEVDRRRDVVNYLVSVKEQLRKVPSKGIGYGMLRYLRPGGEKDLGVCGGADIRFNYLGDFGLAGREEEGGESVFRYAGEYKGEEVSGEQEEGVLLTVTGILLSGELHISLSYSRQQYRPSTIAALAENYEQQLRKLIGILKDKKENYVTPGDITYQGLSIEELNELNEDGRIADVYELSPLQEGIYFHWLADRGTKAYVEQMSYRVRGVLDAGLLEQSYRELVLRHAVLRTSFHHEYGSGPLQIVSKRAEAEFRYERIEGMTDVELEEYKEQDRAEGFDLSTGSQMRLTVLERTGGEYEFIWSYHHILMDGWCVGILIRAFYGLYGELVHGERLLPGREYPYVNYIRWLRKLERGAAEQYWVTYLGGYDRQSAVPFREVFGEGKGYTGGEKLLYLDKGRTERIKGLCRELEITENTFMQGAWGYLLSRYNDVRDVVFGSVVSGRPGELEGVEEMIGLFINTVPVRVRYEEGTRVKELLKRLQQEAIAGMPYHYMRLSEIQSGSGMGNGLFDHIVIYENYPVEELMPVGPVAEKDGSPELLERLSSEVIEQTNYDFNIVLAPEGEGLRVAIRYNKESYGERSVERIGDHFDRTIEAFIGSADSRLGEVEYLSSSERHWLLEEVNDTREEYGEGRTVVDLLMEQVENRPEAIAVVCGEEELSYGELDERSNRLAHYLREQGVKEEVLVPVCLGRSVELLVGILGILKAGGAYVPVDPGYPRERIRYMIADTGAQVVVTDASCAELLDGEGGIRMVLLDKSRSEIAGYPAGRIKEKLRADRLAYVIYTSGSTGTPKGVMIGQGSIYNFINWSRREFGGDDFEVVYAVTSVCFDLSVFEMFYPLSIGKRIRLLKDALSVGEYLPYDKKVLLNTVPGAVKGWLESGVDLSEVTVLNMAGEPVPLKVWNGLMGKDMKIRNLYGPTEGTTYDTCYEQREGSSILIGRPVSNTQIYILDEGRRLVGRGVEGELYIGGVQVARGYINNGLLTAEKFVENPYRMGERMYRTGDRGRWTEEGEIEYLGRRDEQVKIRGYRIELGEVEHALEELEGIGSAVVVVREMGPERERSLVAYFTVSAGRGEGETGGWVSTELRRSLLEKLPEYMVPGYYVRMSELPLTANGKTDRKGLPSPETGLLGSGASYMGPRNAVEEALVEIYGKIFRKEGIGVKESFFDLGGDSIKAILLSGQLKQKGYSVKVGDVLAYPVLEDLALRVVKEQRSVSQEMVEGAVLLTPVQRWFLRQANGRRHHYNQSVLLYSRRRIDRGWMEESLERLALHHDALRMVYTERGGEWEQYNRGWEGESYGLEEYDLRGEEREQERMGALCNEVQGSINLSAGPLLKGCIFRLGDGDRLLLVIHHLVVDGVSWRILLEDLSVLYGELEAGRKGVLPLKSDSFRQWSQWQWDHANSGELLKELSYWQSVEAGRGKGLRVDMEGGRNVPGSRMSAGFSLDRELTEILVTRANRVYNTEMNDMLLASLGLSLGAVFGRTGVLVEMEGHGREEVGEEMNVGRTVGWFTTMYPVLLEVDRRRDVVNYLVSVKEQLRKVPSKGIGYGMLRYLRPGGEKDLGVCGGADIRFNYLGDFGLVGREEEGGESVFRYAGEYKGEEVSGEQEEGVLLTVTGILLSGELHISLLYSRQQYRPSTIAALAENYEQQLRKLIGILKDKKENYVTPGDITYQGLSIEELNELNEDGRIADVYELSPLQEGIYFHWLADRGTKAYVEQMSYRVRGVLDAGLLEQSYRELVLRHAVLRTSFHHEYGSGPLQIVSKRAEAEFRYERIEGMTDVELEEYKEQDRAEGFDLSTGSQMRLTVLERTGGEYEFIWSYHHILMDGWCVGILIREFYGLYGELVHGERLLPGREYPYVNYIRWLSTLNQSASRLYWQERLNGYENPSQVPFSRKLEEEKPYALREEHLELDPDLFLTIKGLCRELEITENTFMQGAWGYLLSRYNDVRDVVFGSVVSGRPGELEGVEEMIGLFINTVPVRVRYEEGTRVKELLKRLQQEAIAGMPYHYMRLSEIQSVNVLRTRLFDHLLTYQNYPVQSIVSEGIEQQHGLSGMKLLSSEIVDQPNYNFNIIISPTAFGIAITIKYNSNCYSQIAVNRMKDHLAKVMEGFVVGVDRPLSAVDYLSAEEEEELLEGFNDTGRFYSGDKTIVDLFRDRAVVMVDEPAVVWGEDRLSYGELEERSNRLAHYLRSKGVKEEMLVPVCMDRSVEMIIGMLGILKAGGGYVPVDPGYPEERIAYMLQDSGCRLVLGGGGQGGILSGSGREVVDIGGKGEWEEMPSTAMVMNPGPEDLAYVIYTSGSTGKPKGVMIEHRSVVNLIEWHIERYGVVPGSRSTMMAGVGFDASALEVWSALLSGSTLYVIKTEIRMESGLLLGFYREHGITHAFVPPALISGLVRREQPLGLSLKYILIGGDRLGRLDVGSLPYRLVNQYGPTESTVMVTEHAVEKEEEGPPPVGRPISNTWLRILDERGQLLPVGITGELYIGGVQLARGYWNREELTREKFVVDRYRAGGRLYRTGDMCRWLENGEVEYIGRKDGQVKIRGYRIEVGEVEHALEELAGIGSAAVVGIGEGEEERELVAYFTADGDRTVSELRQQLLSKLPEHMIPGHYIQLDRMPLTSNGKIDRKALPSPAMAGISSGTDYIAPRNRVEEQLVTIWQKILDIETGIGIRDNFFELGGHSILAVKVLAAISKQFGLVIDIGQMFEEPTIEGLSEKIMNNNWLIADSDDNADSRQYEETSKV